MNKGKDKNPILKAGAYISLAVISIGLGSTIFNWGFSWADLQAQLNLKAEKTSLIALKSDITQIKKALCLMNRDTCRVFPELKDKK